MSMNVLVIDDEPVSLAVLKQLITKLPGCDAHAFTDASAALIWCSHGVPDLAIVDYAMPSLDGIEFARRLRALPHGTEIPIIMVSALVDTQVVRRALRNGVNEFIHKPFDVVELQTCVSEILGLRQMTGQLTNATVIASARAVRRPKADVPRLLDRDLSRARLAGDQTLLRQLARIFIDTVPGVLRGMHVYVVSGDFDAVLSDAILLKGAVSSIEAPDVLHSVSLLEQHANNRNPVCTVSAFARVQALMERLLDELASLAEETCEVADPQVEDSTRLRASPAADI